MFQIDINIKMCFIIACCAYGIIHQTRKTLSLYFVPLKIQLCKLHLKNLILPKGQFLHLHMIFNVFLLLRIYTDFLQNDY